MYQLRIYTIATREEAETYFNVHWQRHIKSLAKYGIHTERVFCELESEGRTRVIGLVRYDEGIDIAASNDQYMRSADFQSDMEGFAMNTIVGVETITMEKASYI